MGSPPIEGFLALGKELVPLVHGRNSGNCASLVIQDLIGQVRRDSEPGHSRDAGPTQIVKSPTTNSTYLVKLTFSATIHVKSPHPVKREDKSLPRLSILQHSERLLGKVDDVFLRILCPRLWYVQTRRARSSSSHFMPATSSRRWPVSANNSTMPPYGPPIFRAARRTRASSWSVNTRSRATSFVGRGTPSAGDNSSTARPTHQRRNVLMTFSVLLAATGAPRWSMPVTTSTTSRFRTSWMLLPPQAFPTSRRRSLAISSAERFWDSLCAMKVSSRSSTRSVTARLLASRFSAARSRPSSFAANTFCAAIRA